MIKLQDKIIVTYTNNLKIGGNVEDENECNKKKQGA